MKTNEIVEKLRFTTNKIIAYRILPFLVSGVLAVFIAMYLEIKEEIKVCLIMGVLVIAFFVVLKGEKRIEKLKEKRNRLYERELNEMLDCACYEPERGFTNIEVGTFGIIKLGSMFYSDNYINGEYKGVGVRQADVVIRGQSYTDESDCVMQYFDGRIFEFRSEKITVQNVKVFSRGYDSRLNVSDYRVDVDDLLFSDNFDVFAPEPSEVKEILTNEMIEHLLILQNKNRSIGFRFGEGKVCVAINGTRPLNLESMDMISYEEKIAIMKEEIQIAIELIEGLGLVDEEIV